MSKRIFQATLSDPDVPDASAETEDDEEPGKSGDSSSDFEAQQSPLKSLKAEGQAGEATEEDLASYAADSASYAADQQTPPSVTAKGLSQGMLCTFVFFFYNFKQTNQSQQPGYPEVRVTTVMDAAYSQSYYACHGITPDIPKFSTGSRQSYFHFA